ncbi:helix-turn-helix domain-containing protein [Paraburkholderia sp. RL17-337-BIB-A]|uniref:helix-turn-helix domain-containing protein n=1 Tax=Paraburkholderia sp. RL17-337-BIB-A TaxID=3031636 RepID=UPI0038BD1E90
MRSVFSTRLAAALHVMDPVPSQRDVATRFAVSASAVNLWLKGETIPDVELLAEVAVWLGVSVDWLFGLQSDRARIKAAPLSIVEYNYIVCQLQRRIFTSSERDALMELVKSTSVSDDVVSGEVGLTA